MEHSRFILAGLMGWPVAHSRSPNIHNHWIAEHGLRGAYVLLPVDPAKLAQALRALPVLGFAGCNLTIPHKVAAMALVNSVELAARRIGAINTVVVNPADRWPAAIPMVSATSRACWPKCPTGVRMSGRLP